MKIGPQTQANFVSRVAQSNEKIEPKKKKDGSYSAKTSHTLNPVPFVITGAGVENFKASDLSDGGLSNIAATVLTLMGYEVPEGYRPSLVQPG